MNPLFYIHDMACVSAQQIFPVADLSSLPVPEKGKVRAPELAYEGIPASALRRMSKALRMGVGVALPLLGRGPSPAGIVIGTANAGFEDCFRFLKQIVDHDEGLLAPGNFVQSTPNALAAQLGMLTHNNGYNATHVHSGLAFENAAIDTGMLINENSGSSYLLGAVDDISEYNFNISRLSGSFKAEAIAMDQLYNADSPGTIAGEAATMFLVSGNPVGSIAQLSAVSTINSNDCNLVMHEFNRFLSVHLPAGERPHLLISGENGDNRLLKFYTALENKMPDESTVLRFKHMTGEYPTASAMALWLACYILQRKPIPPHMLKTGRLMNEYRNIVIYNNFKGMQHSFLLVRPVE